jgi:hypothetical protein
MAMRSATPTSDETRTFATLVTLFRRERLAELYAVGTAAKRRVESLERLKQMLDINVPEKELQHLLEEAPWIIAPEWEVLLMDKSLESFRRNFEDWYQKEYGRPILTTAIDLRRKEPDFIFIQTREHLRIVEIKRPTHRLEDEEWRRAYGYLRAVKKFAKENPKLGVDPTRVRLVIVVDGLNLDDPTYEDAIKNPPVEHLKWREVFGRALNANMDLVDAFEKARQPALTLAGPPGNAAKK